jgi:hypothetical protein
MWILSSVRLSHRNYYIAGGHANRASLCSWKPAQPSPDPAALAEELSPGFQLTPFTDHHWTQTTHHGVGVQLDFPCCYFKRWFMENKRYWVCEWTWVWGNVWQLPDQGSLCLQVSSVRGSWWSLGEAWWRLAGRWNSPVQPLDSPSVITGCTGSPRLQGRGWSGSHALKTKMIIMEEITVRLWKTDSLFPEMTPKAICTCKWLAWERRTRPCITVQDTQCVGLILSPDTILPAGCARNHQGALSTHRTTDQP